MMKILVTTPGGVIGRRVLSELLAPEFSVRVVSRNPELLPRRIREQVELVHGSTEDVNTMRQALDGLDAMFWCIPEGSVDRTNLHLERFTRAAFQAIRETGTPRVVAISAFGSPADARSADFHAMEEILNNSGAAIRHLRCGWLMEDFLRQMNSIRECGAIFAPVPADAPIPFTAAADIADIALHRLVRTDWDGIESAVVQGPEVLSFAQAAAVFERILRQPIRYLQEDPTDGRGQTDEAGESNGEIARISAPTTLAAWVRREFLPSLNRLKKREVDLSEVC
jgi:uncharacterized protein YbjT (DUF2867 family)